MKKLEFENKLNWGHVIQAGAMMISVVGVGVGVHISSRLDRQRVDMRISAQEKRAEEQARNYDTVFGKHEARLDSHDKTLEALAITQVKISTLLEERTKRSN